MVHRFHDDEGSRDMKAGVFWARGSGTKMNQVCVAMPIINVGLI